VTKSFSVRSFGTRAAFKRAIFARTQMLELVADWPYLYNPTAKKLATLGR